MKDSVKDFGYIFSPLVGSRRKGREKRVGTGWFSRQRNFRVSKRENHPEISLYPASSCVISMRKNDESNY